MAGTPTRPTERREPPGTLGEVLAVLRSQPDLRGAVVTALALRLAELPIRLTPDAGRTFFDPMAFDWCRSLEAGWRVIRGELDRVTDRIEDVPPFEALQTAERLLTDDGGWKTYVFYGCGHRNEHNCRECPETARLLARVPGLQTAFFSILEPGKTLPAHRGPYKGVLRYHLGLRIPGGGEACAIRVGSEVRTWAEGKSLIFDDSHEHAAWNRTEGIRAVLFVDFLRPLGFPLSVLNRCVARWLGQSRTVRDGIRRLDAWNRSHGP